MVVVQLTQNIALYISPQKVFFLIVRSTGIVELRGNADYVVATIRGRFSHDNIFRSSFKLPPLAEPEVLNRALEFLINRSAAHSSIDAVFSELEQTIERRIRFGNEEIKKIIGALNFCLCFLLKRGSALLTSHG